MTFDEFFTKLRNECDDADDTSLRHVYDHLVLQAVPLAALLEGEIGRDWRPIRELTDQVMAACAVNDETAQLKARIAELEAERDKLADALGCSIGSQLSAETRSKLDAAELEALRMLHGPGLTRLRKLAKEWKRGGAMAASYGAGEAHAARRNCASELTAALDALEAGR